MTFPTEFHRQVLFRNLSEQFGFIVFTEDVDFGNGDFVEPTFDEAPDGGEEVRRLFG